MPPVSVTMQPRNFALGVLVAVVLLVEDAPLVPAVPLVPELEELPQALSVSASAPTTATDMTLYLNLEPPCQSHNLIFVSQRKRNNRTYSRASGDFAASPACISSDAHRVPDSLHLDEGSEPSQRRDRRPVLFEDEHPFQVTCGETLEIGPGIGRGA